MAHTIKVTVNGVSQEAEVEPRVLSVHYLRMYGSPEPTSGATQVNAVHVPYWWMAFPPSRAPCLPCRPTAGKSPQLKDLLKMGSYIHCRKLSAKNTDCSAVSARPASFCRFMISCSTIRSQTKKRFGMPSRAIIAAAPVITIS